MRSKSALKDWLSQEPGQGKVELGKGKENKFVEFMLKFRDELISRGFEEVALPVYLDKGDVVTHRGMGFYLSDYFFLSGTERQGVSRRDVEEAVPGLGKEAYERIVGVFEDYRSGRIRTRELPGQLVARAGLLLDQAILLVDSLVKPKPRVTSLVLRNSMIDPWLEALRVLCARYPSPQAYFTIGSVFDPNSEKIKTRYVASGVIVGDSSVSQMVDILRGILKEFDVSPETREMVVGDTALMPRSVLGLVFRGHEFGYVGHLSFTSLKKLGIEDPAVFFEIDLLALYRAMGKQALGDLYPYLFGEWYIPDEEIARYIGIKERPETDLGKEILAAIRKNADLYASQPAPCEFKVFEREFEEKALEVWLVGYEKSLVGPGFNNEIFVYKGSILALPPTGDHEAIVKGVRTGIKLGEALANAIARQIELDPQRPREFQFDRTSLENANIFIPRQIQDYVKHIGADIRLEAPVFFKVEARIRKLWVYKGPE